MVEPKKLPAASEQPVSDGQPSIRDIYLKCSANIVEQTRKCDTDAAKQLMQFQDVLCTTHPLARLLRMVLSDHKVTNAEFEDKHRTYAEAAGYLSQQIGYNRNNIKKAICRPRITWQMFEQVVLVILGFSLDDVIIKLKHPTTGENLTYSLEGILKLAKEVYGNENPLINNIEIPQLPTGEDEEYKTYDV